MTFWRVQLNNSIVAPRLLFQGFEFLSGVMTIQFQHTVGSPGLLDDENVLGPLAKWQSDGLKVAIVTLVGVEGGAPRQPGAQMAVAEDGRYAGYLSGGCLEGAVALEAQAVIRTARPRLVRYGKGSPYFDVKLPCGSGLDLYFDPTISSLLVADMLARTAARTPFVLRTHLVDGRSDIETVTVSPHGIEASRRDGDKFARIYAPKLKTVLLGHGPALVAMASLATALGIDVAIYASDDLTLADLDRRGLQHTAVTSDAVSAIRKLDFASASVLMFHDHEQEPDLLSSILESQAFYIGALGNHAVHRARLKALSDRGFDDATLARIKAPVGMISGAKSKATVAISALGELMAEAKARNLIS